jgi:uncharacterized membrane protein
MTNILIGMVIMYFICGLIAFIFNTFDFDEDIKDMIFGWWIIVIGAIISFIYVYFPIKFITRKKMNKLLDIIERNNLDYGVKPIFKNVIYTARVFGNKKKIGYHIRQLLIVIG